MAFYIDRRGKTKDKETGSGQRVGAEGVWRDDERDGNLVRDQPRVVHCYTTIDSIEDPDNLRALREFCQRLGRDTNQGEVGVVIDDEYFAIREFEEDES